MKFKQGWIGKDGQKVWIYAKSALPAKVRDVAIGVGVILAGATYLAWKAFDHGAGAYEKAEFETLKSLDLISPSATEDDWGMVTPSTHKMSE